MYTAGRFSRSYDKAFGQLAVTVTTRPAFSAAAKIIAGVPGKRSSVQIEYPENVPGAHNALLSEMKIHKNLRFWVMRFCAAAALLQRVQYAALHAVYPAAGSAEQIRITGGNDGLAVLHSAEQVRLSRFIQLGKHVVQQHHRMLARDFLRARSLGQLQAEHSAALLPLAGENLCRRPSMEMEKSSR